MKYSVLLLLTMLIAFSCPAQQYKSLLKELDLPEVDFEKAIDVRGAEKSITTNFYFQNKRIKNDYFDLMDKVFDENLILRKVTFNFKNERIFDKKFEEIYSVLVDHYGDPYQVDDKIFSKAYYFFNGSENIKFSNRDGYIAGGLIISRANFNLRYKTDDFTKNTLINVSTEYPPLRKKWGDPFYVDFKGLIKGNEKFVGMTITTTGSDWKFIEKVIFLTENGESFEIELVAETEIILSKTHEVGSCFLPDELVDIVKSQNDLRIRIIGKSNYDFQMHEQMYLAFDKIRNEIYK